MMCVCVCIQRNHSLFGTVKALQKSALPSNGVRSALPAGVPRLVIPDAPSSEMTDGSDEMPSRFPARYGLLYVDRQRSNSVTDHFSGPARAVGLVCVCLDIDFSLCFFSHSLLSF